MQTGISETKSGIFDMFISQQIGKYTPKGVRTIEKKNDKFKRRKNDNEIKWDNLYSLNKINPLVVLAKRNSSQGQFDFLLSFYKTLQNHPDFRDTDIKITPSMTKADVIKVFHKKVLELCGDKYDYEYDVSDDHFCLSIYRNIAIDYRNNSIQLYWLDNLEKENKKLYNITTRALSIIAKSLCLELWDEGYEDNWKEYFAGELDDRNYSYEEIKDAMDEYQELLTKSEVKLLIEQYDGPNTSKMKVKNGKSIKHLARLNKSFSLSKLKSDLENFKPKGRLEKQMIKWIKEGLKLTEIKYTLHDFKLVTNEECEEGLPLSITESYKFSWNFHSDYWEHHIETYLNDTYAHYGAIGARGFIHLDEDRAFISDSEEKEKAMHQIHNWFTNGHDLYWDVLGKYLNLVYAK